MKKQIKFIYFDLGSVLFSFSGGLKNLAKENNRSYAELEKVFKKYDDQACRGQITPQELWELYKKELNLETNISDFAEYWTDNFHPIKETHTLVRELSRVYPIGILTNIYLGVFPIVVRKKFIPAIDYKSVICSCDIGLVKPEMGIYKNAQKESSVDPEEILFIDDKRPFVDAANKLGWNTILFEENDPAGSAGKIKRFLTLNN